MRIFLLIFGLSLPAVTAHPKSYIIAGQEVEQRDPVRASTIGIFSPSRDRKTGSLCTGTLIRKDIALTAAHCIPSGGQKPILIFHRDIHSPNSVRRQAEGVAVNRKWRTRAGRGMDQGDIALIKFKGGLPRGYKKVATVRTDKEIRSGASVILAGYGISNARTKLGSGRLRKTTVQILHNRPGKSEMILDQSHGRGACHGDSGGPAFISRNGKMVLAGVTNRSYPSHAPDDCAHQSVYTKVPAYRSWIQKNEKKLDAAPTIELRSKKHLKKRSRLKHAHPKHRKNKARHKKRATKRKT